MEAEAEAEVDKHRLGIEIQSRSPAGGVKNTTTDAIINFIIYFTHLTTYLTHLTIYLLLNACRRAKLRSVKTFECR